MMYYARFYQEIPGGPMTQKYLCPRSTGGAEDVCLVAAQGEEATIKLRGQLSLSRVLAKCREHARLMRPVVNFRAFTLHSGHTIARAKRLAGSTLIAVDPEEHAVLMRMVRDGRVRLEK